MPRNYVISRATYALFARHVRPVATWRKTAKPRWDGQLDLLLDDDVTEVLEQRRLPGETDDELLLRVLSGPSN